METHSRIDRTLYITNQCVIKVLALWEKYQDLRFFDSEELFAQSGPMKVSYFRSVLLVQSEKCRDRLLNGYANSTVSRHILGLHVILTNACAKMV